MRRPTFIRASKGFRSIVTQDGHEAMAAIRAEEGAVIAILDLMMPRMDGLEVCRRIRESRKQAHIILLTALAAKESLVEGLKSGADDYLVKPFSFVKSRKSGLSKTAFGNLTSISLPESIGLIECPIHATDAEQQVPASVIPRGEMPYLPRSCVASALLYLKDAKRFRGGDRRTKHGPERSSA